MEDYNWLMVYFFLKIVPQIVLEVFLNTPTHCTIGFIVALFVSNSANAHASNSSQNQASPAQAAKILEYQLPATSCKKGAYQTPDLDFINQGVLEEGGVSIDAGSVSLVKSGASWFKDGVIIKQQNRLLKASRAKVIRKDGKIWQIQLFGPVSLYEPETLLKSDKATLNYQTGEGELSPLYYRMSFKSRNISLEDLTLFGQISAWGQASSLKRDGNDVFYLKSATISTCPPQALSWQIKAKDIVIDKKKGQGKVYKAWLSAFNQPLLYLPYWNFSLDDKRKSGFLVPRVSYRSVNGLEWMVPYYLNLAPNYDLTLMPHYFEKRGLMAKEQFRYLFPWGEGELKTSYLNQDNKYRDFLLDNNLLLPNTDLSRSEINWHHKGQWQNWQFHFDYGEVSDDYYPQDFSTSLNFSQSNQIKRKAEAIYDDEDWHFALKFQRFQTLHPINQSQMSEIYRLYPQIDIATWQPINETLMASLEGQFSQFDWASNNNGVPIGGRYYLKPGLSQHLSFKNIELVPMAKLNLRYYQLSHYNNANQTFSSAIPEFSLLASSHFWRNISLNHHLYNQTLTPKAYYLYVPYESQNNIPLFDTSETIFDYSQLFAANRFTGIDRIGDSHRLSVALESELYQDSNNQSLANVAAGLGFYFKDRKVLDCFNATTNCQMPENLPGSLSNQSNLTPFAVKAQFFLDRHWSVLSTGAYELNDDRVNNASLSLHYQNEDKKALDIGYGFLKYGENINLSSGYQNSANLSQIRLSFSQPVNERLKLSAGYNYNFGFSHEMGYFAALHYDSCCIASRFLAGRLFNTLSTSGQPKYNNVIYWQLLFKGLGNIGNGSLDGLMNEFARRPGL